MGDITQLGFSLLAPLQQIWYSFVQSVPGLLAAIIVILVGYIVANIVARLLTKVFDKAKFDKWCVDKTHLKNILGDFKLSAFLTMLVKWYVFVAFLPSAAQMTDMTFLSTFLIEIARYIPNAIVAILVSFVGLAAAEYTSDVVKATKAKGAGVLAMLAKVIILVFTALMALDQIGIAVSVARDSFLIVLSGVMLALSLALGIGFGLGLKDEARGMLKDLKRRL